MMVRSVGLYFPMSAEAVPLNSQWFPITGVRVVRGRRDTTVGGWGYTRDFVLGYETFTVVERVEDPLPADYSGEWPLPDENNPRPDREKGVLAYQDWGINGEVRSKQVYDEMIRDAERDEIAAAGEAQEAGREAIEGEDPCAEKQAAYDADPSDNNALELAVCQNENYPDNPDRYSWSEVRAIPPSAEGYQYGFRYEVTLYWERYDGEIVEVGTVAGKTLEDLRERIKADIEGKLRWSGWLTDGAWEMPVLMDPGILDWDNIVDRDIDPEDVPERTPEEQAAAEEAVAETNLAAAQRYREESGTTGTGFFGGGKTASEAAQETDFGRLRAPGTEEYFPEEPTPQEIVEEKDEAVASFEHLGFIILGFIAVMVVVFVMKRSGGGDD